MSDESLAGEGEPWRTPPRKEAPEQEQQLHQLHEQMQGIVQRVERIEQRLGWSPPPAPAEAPSVSAASPTVSVTAPVTKPMATTTPASPPPHVASSAPTGQAAVKPLSTSSVSTVPAPAGPGHAVAPSTTPGHPATNTSTTAVPSPGSSSAPTGSGAAMPAHVQAAVSQGVHEIQERMKLHTRLGGTPSASAAPSSAVPHVPSNLAPQKAKNAADDTRAARGVSGDWENLIGGKWALWIGSMCLFLAIASFLAYTWKSSPPPPWARVSMGMAAGAAFLVAGGFFRDRVQRWFSEGLMGTGLSVLYLSIWAATQYFDLLPLNYALLGMSLTTALGVYLSVRYDAVGLNTLAVIGGFATPVVLHSGGGGGGAKQAMLLLTYIAVLNAGILAVSLFKRWRGITWLNYAATLMLVGKWATDAYNPSLRITVMAFATLYFLQFFGASCFYSLRRKEATAQTDLLLLFSSTVAYSMAGYALVQPISHAFPASFPLAMMLFFGFMTAVVRSVSPTDKALRYSLGGLAIFFLTIALPIQLKQHSLAIGWSVEAAILLILAHLLRGRLFLRSGQIVWGLSFLPLFLLLASDKIAAVPLFLNGKAVALLISSVAFAVVSFFANRANSLRSTDETAELYPLYAVLGGAYLIGQETLTAFQLHDFPMASTATVAGWYAIAALLSLYACSVFAFGLKVRHGVTRASACLVMLMAVALPLWVSIAHSEVVWPPFWNLRLLSYAVVATMLVLMARLSWQHREELALEENGSLGIIPNAVSLFVLAALSTETYLAFRYGAQAATDWQVPACFSLSMFWSVYAGVLLLAGCVWKRRTWRWQSYAICGASVLLLLYVALDDSNVFRSMAPITNLRLVSFLVVAAVSMATAWMLRTFGVTEEKLGSEARDASLGLGLLSSLVLLWGLTQEIYFAFKVWHVLPGAYLWSLGAMLAISVVWNAFAWVTLRFGIKAQHKSFEWAGTALASGAIGLLLTAPISAVKTDWTPLLNLRFGAFTLAIATLWSISHLLKRAHEGDNRYEDGILLLRLGLPTLLLWMLTQETYETCYYLRHLMGVYWARWASMSISVVWSVFGAGLLIAGIHSMHRSLRVAALGLLSVTVIKVFVFDLSFLTTGLRILSLGGLGLSLLFISWLYSRYVQGEKQVAQPSV